MVVHGLASATDCLIEGITSLMPHVNMMRGQTDRQTDWQMERHIPIPYYSHSIKKEKISRLLRAITLLKIKLAQGGLKTP